MLDELKAELSHLGAERMSSQELQTSKCKQEGWQNAMSCILAIVLIHFFCLTEVVNFPLFTSQDIISKYHSQNGNFDFNKYISIQWRRWCYRFVLSISPCIVYSITRRVEIDSLGVRYFIRRPIGNSLAKGWERRMASLRIFRILPLRDLNNPRFKLSARVSN